jgi:cell division protein FtsB
MDYRYKTLDMVEIEQLKKENAELKSEISWLKDRLVEAEKIIISERKQHQDKVSRRNMQIKDLEKKCIAYSEVLKGYGINPDIKKNPELLSGTFTY